jgi:8-oxo-dGTP diphosphatase
MTPQEIDELDHRRVYEISVKGLCLDDGGKILVLKEDKGTWELPGGGLEHGEDILECLKRECLEEVGVECEIVDYRPLHVWVGTIRTGHLRLIILYRIKFINSDFKKTPEAEAVQFVSNEEFKQLNLVPQLNKLKEIL